MRNILLLMCLLIAFNVNAFTLNEQWIIPTERENCIEYDVDGFCVQHEPLPINEISHYTMYDVDCITEELTTVEPTIIYQNTLTVLFWSSLNSMECFVMTTTDTVGRESKYSTVFYAVEWGAPKPVECVP